VKKQLKIELTTEKASKEQKAWLKEEEKNKEKTTRCSKSILPIFQMKPKKKTLSKLNKP